MKPLYPDCIRPEDGSCTRCSLSSYGLDCRSKPIITEYQRRKEAARQEVIDTQRALAEKAISYGELAEIKAHFEKLGRRYGLLQEFRENGIC